MFRNSQAALFHGPNSDWEIRTAHADPPADRQILVRVLACTICGSDLHTICGRRAAHTPAILGHEIIGEILEFGTNTPSIDAAGQPLSPGDRIVWTVVASCGECFFCQHDLPQKCLKGYKYGHQHIADDLCWHGGFASHCTLLPGTQIVKIPKQIDDLEAAPLSCATATIAAALRTLKLTDNESVLVIGAGMLGLTACAMAHTLRPSALVCIEPDPYRRSLALRFGATACVSPNSPDSESLTLKYPLGFDAVIECSGSNPGAQTAIQMARTGGRIILVGAVFPSEPVPIVVEQLVRKQLSIHGVHNYQIKDLLAATEFMGQYNNRFPFKELVEHSFPLEQIQQAITCAQVPQNIRVAIRP